MRLYIGHKMKFVVEGFPAPVTGVMTNEDQYFVYLKSEAKDETWRLPKGKICGFTPLDFEPLDYVPIHVLFCRNDKTKCPGLKYAKEGEGFSRKDMELFMEPCPCKSAECSRGTKGELRSMSGKILKDMLVGMLFGDYPEKRKGNKDGNDNDRRTGETVEHSKTEGGGSSEGEEQADGGTGQLQEEVGGIGEEMPR